jgi:hypothetical protein
MLLPGSLILIICLPTRIFCELESRLLVSRELVYARAGSELTDSETHFKIGELTYKLFDVGGQRSER